MIEVQDLTYRYPGGQRAAVAGTSFRVGAGEIFGFLGPSGAGKTTTQKVLIGLLDGYSGRVEVAGREVADWGPDLYERIGISFESPTHFGKLTAVENLAFFASLYAAPGADPRELLARVGLQDDIDTRVGEFSKGMKNRLTVARALLHEPELLFLDEPTAGLDPVNARRIRELVADQREAGRTVLLTTHDMVTADLLCDRVAFIVDGKIPLIGSPRALRMEHGRRVVELRLSDDGADDLRELPLDGLGDNAEFLALLRGGRVESMHTQEATLEQVFVDVTGRALA